MATHHPTWIYLGHSATQTNPDWNGPVEADRSTSQTEAQTVVGASYQAKDMQGVQMTTNTVGSSPTMMRGTDPLSYTLSVDGVPQPETTTVYTSHVVVNVTISVARADPLAPGGMAYDLLDLRAVRIQTATGDIFMRPYYLDLSNWNTALQNWSIREIHIDSLVTDLNPPSSNTDAYTGGLTAETGFNPSFIDDGSFICFAAGTLIATPGGERRIEDLRVGDPVCTADNGAQPLRWIGRRKLDSRLLDLRPELRPIRIAAGALGEGLPTRDLVVSPQHRVLISGPVSERMFGRREVLVAARHLLHVPGLNVLAGSMREADYLHILLDRHEIVLANGIAAETLLPGPQALKMMGDSARREIMAIFPGLHAQALPPAREIVDGRKARHLMMRQARWLSGATPASKSAQVRRPDSTSLTR